jgi:hypothetical protein
MTTKTTKTVTVTTTTTETYKACAFDGCTGKAVAKGLCPIHYQQARRGVELYKVVRKGQKNDVHIRDGVAYLQITTRKGKLKAESVIDVCDVERVINSGRWNYNGKYVTRHGKGSEDACVYLHRFISPPNEGEEVDHWNGDTLDNRSTNIKSVSHRANLENRKPWGKSGLRNIAKTPSGKWHVRVSKDGKDIHGGTFADLEEAKAKAVAMRAKYFSHVNEDLL